MERSHKYYVGIDIASKTFAASFLEEPQQPIQTREFTNALDGFDHFDVWLQDNSQKPSNTVICLEATGVYGEALCYWLVAKGYQVAVEPPLKVKRAFKIKNHKTDPVDSRQIAEYAYRYYDELQFWQPRSEIIEQINVLLMMREQFVEQKTANSNALHSIKRKIVTTPMANELFELNIKQLSAQIKEIEQEIKKLIGENPHFKNFVSLLDGIPSVGLLLAANMLVITNGFEDHRQIQYRKLANHVSICPLKHTSGTSVRGKPTALNMGPKRMRKLLHLAARCLITHREAFRHYYAGKLAEGKERKLVLNNVSNKLLKIMCAVIRTGKQYNPDHISINPAFLKTA